MAPIDRRFFSDKNCFSVVEKKFFSYILYIIEANSIIRVDREWSGHGGEG